jgi:hypothetical protein
MDASKRPIILLDLNYTLVANSEVKLQPFARQIEQEVYRSELIDAIRDLAVILITARPEAHRTATLESIKRKTGWAPRSAYFNTLRTSPPVFKAYILRKEILPVYAPSDLLAIESNPATRRMYESQGVDPLTWDQFLQVRSALPTAKSIQR